MCFAPNIYNLDCFTNDYCQRQLHKENIIVHYCNILKTNFTSFNLNPTELYSIKVKIPRILFCLWFYNDF